MIYGFIVFSLCKNKMLMMVSEYSYTVELVFCIPSWNFYLLSKHYVKTECSVILDKTLCGSPFSLE